VVARRRFFGLFTSLIVSMNRIVLPLALAMLMLGGAVIALSQRPWRPGQT